MSEDDRVDRTQLDAGGGKVLRETPQRRTEQVRGAGVDQDELVAGVDKPFIDRRWDRIFWQEARFEQFWSRRGIARKNLGFERQPTVVEYGDLKGCGTTLSNDAT
jgi:hypothetical protein